MLDNNDIKDWKETRYPLAGRWQSDSTYERLAELLQNCVTEK